MAGPDGVESRADGSFRPAGSYLACDPLALQGVTMARPVPDIIRIDWPAGTPAPSAATDAALDRAAALVRDGGLVAIPTETVYGLAADALDADAVDRIFHAKGRPANNPLIVHVADAAMARSLAASWPAAAERIATALWPGPVTVVVPKGPRIPENVTAAGPTVALRCPAQPLTRRLIERSGIPLAAPSANRSEQVSPTTAQHVLDGLGAKVGLILDAGPCERGIESTVVDCTTSPPRILRPGPLSRAELEAAIGGPVACRRPVVGPGPVTRQPPSPLLSTNAARAAGRPGGPGRRVARRRQAGRLDRARGLRSAQAARRFTGTRRGADARGSRGLRQDALRHPPRPRPAAARPDHRRPASGRRGMDRRPRPSQPRC